MTRKPESLLAEGELVAGRLAGLFGVRGELKCDVSIGERPLAGVGECVQLVLAAHEGGEPQARRVELVVRSLRPHAGRWLIAFVGVEDANAAQRYVGARLVVRAEALPTLPEGEYYDHQLVGCSVYDVSADADGVTLGTVARVEHWPASDVLVLADGAMVPLVCGYEPQIDLAARRITMTLPPGLIDPKRGETA